jgi:hypothetical protein
VEANAKLIGRFVHDEGGIITISALIVRMGLTEVAAAKAAGFARDQKWIAVKTGFGGGYTAGNVEPPE